jgi:hypothetical protein
MVASSTSWKRTPFNEGVPLRYRAAFDARQFVLIKAGHIPRDMDDKWFIYYEDPCLYLHRSWTGLPAYRVTLKNTSDGAEAVEALRSIPLADSSQVNLDYEAALLDFFMSNILLGEAKPLPPNPKRT